MQKLFRIILFIFNYLCVGLVIFVLFDFFCENFAPTMGCSVSKGDVVTRRSTRRSTRRAIPNQGITPEEVWNVLNVAQHVYNQLHKQQQELKQQKAVWTAITQITQIDRSCWLSDIEDQEDEIARALPLICLEAQKVVVKINTFTDEGYDVSVLEEDHRWWEDCFNSLSVLQTSFASMKQSLLRSNVSEIVAELDALEKGDSVDAATKKVPLPPPGRGLLPSAGVTGPQPTNTA